jgi:hypothetical protein
MKMWTIILTVIMGATACQKTNHSLEKQPCNDKQTLANQVRRKAASRLKEELKLRPCGTIGQMLHEIQILGLTFYCYQPVDILEGRKLLVKAIDTMLEEVNNESQIHPYLVRCPFKPRNVEIQIFLWNPDGREVSFGSLCILEAEGGMLRYLIDVPEKANGITTVYQETYEEAIQRLADPILPPVPYKPDSRKITSQDLIKLRNSVSFVDSNGSIWHLDENGCWAK